VLEVLEVLEVLGASWINVNRRSETNSVNSIIMSWTLGSSRYTVQYQF
jgi:hypothetical protein